MKKILVIDDDIEFCDYIKQFLEVKKEFSVTTCTTSKNAVKIAEETLPDVILLDIQMPEISGPEIADKISKNPKTRNIPIIYVTCLVTENETLKFDNIIGGKYFISKPVDIDKLTSLIKTMVG